MTYGCALSDPECKATYKKPPRPLTQKKERESMGAEDASAKAIVAEEKARDTARKSAHKARTTSMKARVNKKQVEKQLTEVVGMKGEDRDAPAPPSRTPTQSDPVPEPPAKKKGGRPKKYATAEEAKEAKRQMTKESDKRRKEAKKNAKAPAEAPAEAGTTIIEYHSYPAPPVVGERFYSEKKKALFKITNKQLKIDKEFICSFGTVKYETTHDQGAYITDEPVFEGFHLVLNVSYTGRPYGIITKELWDDIKDDRKKVVPHKKIISGGKQRVLDDLKKLDDDYSEERAERVNNFFRQLGVFNTIGDPDMKVVKMEYYGKKHSPLENEELRLIENKAYYERRGARARTNADKIKKIEERLREIKSKGKGLEGEGSNGAKDFFNKIGNAFKSRFNDQGSPLDRKASSVILNKVEPVLIKPLQILAPPVGDIAEAQRQGLKQHYGLGVAKKRGRPRKAVGEGLKVGYSAEATGGLGHIYPISHDLILRMCEHLV
jgi:hypothetical protein